MSRLVCRWNNIYGLLLRELRGDEQRDICWRTRPGNQVNGGGVDSLREASSVLRCKDHPYYTLCGIICVSGFHGSGWGGQGRPSEEVEMMTDQTRQTGRLGRTPPFRGRSGSMTEVVGGTGMNRSSCGWDQTTEVSNACLRSTCPHCGLSHLNL